MDARTLRQLYVTVVLTVTAVVSFHVLSSCKNNGSGQTETAIEQRLPDTLRVATLYSPTSYFLYRDEPMGYDYSLLMQFAADKGMVVDLTVASSLGKMIEMLDSGDVDLLAYDRCNTTRGQRGLCGREFKISLPPAKS